MSTRSAVTVTLMLMVATVLVVGVRSAGAQSAGSSTGTTSWLCALTAATECENEGECQRRSLSEIAASRFHMIELGKKTITAIDRAAAGSTTPIDRIERADGRVLLQGVQRGRVVSIALDEATGSLSAAVVEPGTVFALSGACTPVFDSK